MGTSSHPGTPDRGAGSAAGLDARRRDAEIAALFGGAATLQTGSPRPNPPTGGASGWEQVPIPEPRTEEPGARRVWMQGAATLK